MWKFSVELFLFHLTVSEVLLLMEVQVLKRQSL